MLKELYAELDGPPAASAEPPRADAGAPRHRAGPLARQSGLRDVPVAPRLNKPGSEKETWHIEIDLAGSGLDYAVGDCFGIFPANDPALVDAVIAALDAPPDFPSAAARCAKC